MRKLLEREKGKYNPIQMSGNEGNTGFQQQQQAKDNEQSSQNSEPKYQSKANTEYKPFQTYSDPGNYLPVVLYWKVVRECASAK